MLGTMLKNWRRRSADTHAPAAGDAETPGVAAQNAVTAAIHALLRAPMAHPASVDYEMLARLKAAAEAADYMVANMMQASNLVGRAELIAFALDACRIEGLMLEFGVYRGESLRFIAKRVAQEVHGFDSFEGLPEDWTYFQKQGRFSLDGNVPALPERNVRLYKGWFDRTLPAFLAEHAGPARFIHIDCDIYASTRTVFELLGPRIAPGTVILFDEYLNYPSWREHEFKAFQEWAAARQLKYRYIGFASSHTSVAVIVESAGR